MLLLNTLAAGLFQSKNQQFVCVFAQEYLCSGAESRARELLKPSKDSASLLLRNVQNFGF